jgi:hypothetical protein
MGDDEIQRAPPIDEWNMNEIDFSHHIITEETSPD